MKHFSLFILAFFLCSLAFSQQDFKGELYFGAGGGAMVSNVDFSPTIPQTFKVGMLGGVSAKYISQKHLGLLAEVNFAQRGWKEDYDTSTGFVYNRTLNYLEVPLMTHVYFGNRTRFILNLGPQVSFLLGGKDTMSPELADDLAARRQENPEARIGEQYAPMDSLNKVDYGLVGGIGMELKTGIGVFDLEGRYYFGLGDIFNSRRTKQAYFSRSAARVIEAKLTYYIRIK